VMRPFGKIRHGVRIVFVLLTLGTTWIVVAKRGASSSGG
jgi:hypothetical protein